MLEMQEVLGALLERWSEFEITDADFSGAPYTIVCKSFSVRYEPETALVG
jgi:hypothetical protein